MTSPLISNEAVEQTARLTDRLQQTVVPQPTAPAPPLATSWTGERHHTAETIRSTEPNRAAILEDLNVTIKGIISDTPLMLPEPLNDPETNVLPVNAARAVALPEEGDHLSHWLSRSPEELPERRSPSQVITICLGIMMLSILAGYGSAQLLNLYLDKEAATPRDWKAAATTADVTLDWSNRNEEVPFSSETTSERVRVAPARRINAVEHFPSPVPTTSALTASLTDDTVNPEPAIEPERVSGISQDPALRSSGNASELDLNEIANGEVANREAAGVDEELPPSFEDEPDTEQVPEPTQANPVTPSVSTRATIATEDATRMLERADRLIDNGDIAGARLILRHLAEAGDGLAALKLAQAFDPDWLAAQGDGIPANRDFALRWYAMARDRGETRAQARIEALQATE